MAQLVRSQRGGRARLLLLAAVAAAVLVLATVLPLAAHAARVQEYDPDEFEGVDAVVGGGATDDADAVPSTQRAASAFADDAFEDEDEVDDFEADDAANDGVDGAAAQAAAAEAAAEAERQRVAANEEKVSAAMDDMLAARTYQMEMVAIAGLVLFVLVFLYGRIVNERIASAWERQFATFLEQQFVQVIGADPGRLVTKTSQNSFKLFATGRRGCRGMLCQLDLKRRQNLLDILTGLMTRGDEDLLTITFPKNKIEPVVLAVVHKLAKKQVQQAAPNLATYARLRESDRVPDECELMTDCPEVVKQLLTEQVAATLAASKYFRMMYVTDEAVASDSSPLLAPCELRFQFVLPAAGKMEELTPLMHLAVYMVDAVSALRLSSDARRIADKQRQARRSARLSDSRGDRAAAQKRRQEEKLAKEQEEYNRMTPAQRAKWDEKRDAKRARKRRPRMKMKM